MNCLNCNNQTKGKYCSRECCSEFKRMKRENLGKDGEEFLSKYDKVPTPNELKQFVNNRAKSFTISDQNRKHNQ